MIMYAPQVSKSIMTEMDIDITGSPPCSPHLNLIKNLQKMLRRKYIELILR